MSDFKLRNDFKLYNSWFHVKLHGILQRGDLQRASRFSVFNPPSLCKHHQTPTQTDTEGGLFFLYYTCFLMFYRSLNTTLPRSQAITHPGYTGETHFMTVTHLVCAWTQKKALHKDEIVEGLFFYTFCCMRQIECLQPAAKLFLFCFLRRNYSFMAHVSFTDVVCHYSWNTTWTQQEPEPPYRPKTPGFTACLMFSWWVTENNC